jgi:outer membrane receptor protein involved in Fe transport
MTTGPKAHLRAAVRRALFSAAIGLPAGTYAVAASAADEGGIQEVVVTAQKRAQDLESVPISVQALTGTKLDELQVNDFAGYVQYLPSVSYTTGSTGLPGNSSVIFRGIATDGGLIASATLPTVGVYLDEQPITSILGSVDVHIYDVARIEALAGPQGTLYGASSEAGTLRIITNKPDPTKFSASYDLDANKILVGSAGGGLDAYANIPLIADKVALRVVGWYTHTGGYIDNVYRERTFPSSGITQTNPNLVGNDLNTVDTYGGRALLGIDINENWTVTPSVIAQSSKWNGTFRSDDTKVGELKVGHYFPEYGHDDWYQAGLTISGHVSDFEVTYAGYYMDRNRSEHNDYSDYGFYYDALNGSGAFVVDNNGNMVDPSQLNINLDDASKLSHELRIATPQQYRVRGIAGLFYQKQIELTENDYLIKDFADDLSVPGRPGQVWLTKEKRIDIDKAIFAQADFDLTKQLTLTGGIRAYQFDNSLVGFYGVNSTYYGTGVAQCLGPPVGPYGLGAAVVDGTPCTNLGVLNADDSISPKRSTGNGTTWRGNLAYKLTPDNLLYATVSTGFRPGGINRAGTGAPFGADHLENYEVGSKNTFLDHHLTLNVTAFYEDWKDVQVTYQAPGGSGVALITNAGGARTRGIEGDFTWRASSGFSLNGAATFLNAELTTPLYTGDTTPSAPAGQKLPLTPDFKGTLTARYEFPVGETAAHVQLAGAYIGERNAVLVTADQEKTGPLPGYFTLQASAGGAKNNFSYEVYVTNLTDARGQQSRAAECNINYCGPSSYDPVGEIYRIYIQPRTIGLRFGQKF